MNDNDLDLLVTRADPFGAGPSPDAATDLFEEIITSKAPTPRTRDSRRRPIYIAVAVAVVVAIVAVTGAVIPGGNPAAPVPAYAEAREFAEHNPRMLLGPPWKAIDIGTPFSAHGGELIFTDGKHEVRINWRPKDQYQIYSVDRLPGGKEESVKVLGRTAKLFEGPARKDNWITVFPVEGETFVDIQGALGSEAAYREMLAALRIPDIDSWLAAMPASAVLPGDHAKVVAEALEGIPLPPRFNRDALDKKADVSNRYQIGVVVTTKVVCAWVDQWRTAKRAGDQAGVGEARAALGTARSWKILLEMQREGGWPRAIWSITDPIAKQNRWPYDGLAGMNC
ncbi:hypothetical protein [Kribbella solani]|uniref:Uncharacterized protein n=1 Tax=Kribbella solani TaxID=236067 RepID=A0A841DMG8_9ACTN|nr:hypothetical protein [Kribbella solani]MBB5977966.1 hypothetical protein [Kribbella solani]